MRRLVYYGDKRLRQKSHPVKAITPEIRQLVEDMVETMLESGRGVGLAAPQVGQLLRLFVVCYQEGESRPTAEVFINPVLSAPSREEEEGEEGCLSIPGFSACVVRPKAISVTALDLEGNTFTKRYSGYKARIIMHENDHLNGVLFIDRLSKRQRQLAKPLLLSIKKKQLA